MGRERQRLEELRRWRQLAVRAPVVWFPVLIYGLLTEETALALTLGFAGLIFAGAARTVVWSRRCPRCGVRFGRSSGVFREIWDQAACLDCGLSLFRLRRGERDG